MSRKKTQNKTNIILKRISDHYHLRFDDDIAKFYGVQKSTISSWRTRDSINETLIRAKCNDDNLANWFINGIKTQEEPAGKIAESKAPYNANTTAPRISELLTQTAAVLESSTIFSSALKSNIVAFHTAVTCEQQLAVALKRIDDLEVHVKLIEKRLPAIVNGS